MLSTVTSTASMDKSKESQERGITLDLGFSSFSTDAPEHIQDRDLSQSKVVFGGLSRPCISHPHRHRWCPDH
ncbi:unnamed protein product [Durusdinium trenchii]|uniref:Uncharacterized protein n=1 Tax=Durusdinium trenchii TaxID=1381693 RepID=A0ABP0RY29_9DINO